MITKKTLLTLNLLHDLVYKADDLDGFSKRYISDAQGVLSTETAAGVLRSVRQASVQLEEVLVEALENTVPEFADTPFADVIAEIIAGFKDGSSRKKLHSSVELAKLHRTAGEWLQEKERAMLPLQTFKVNSAFGQFVVQETDGSRARVKAAEQHYGKTIEQLGHDVLRDFAIGVACTL